MCKKEIGCCVIIILAALSKISVAYIKAILEVLRIRLRCSIISSLFFRIKDLLEKNKSATDEHFNER